MWDLFFSLFFRLLSYFGWNVSYFRIMFRFLFQAEKANGLSKEIMRKKREYIQMICRLVCSLACYTFRFGIEREGPIGIINCANTHLQSLWILIQANKTHWRQYSGVKSARCIRALTHRPNQQQWLANDTEWDPKKKE